MNFAIILKPCRTSGWPSRGGAIQIGGASGTYQNARHIKRPVCRTRGFSLVEVTLALGIAAFCLLTVFALVPVALKTQQASVQQTIANQIINELVGDLRADIRLPPGQASHEGDSGFGLHGHWAQLYAPDTVYFNEQGKWLQLNGSPPADATFRATIVVSWPAQVDPATVTPAGSVQQFIAVNR
jgi:uncharacterized protein (TIGR02598 family)